MERKAALYIRVSTEMQAQEGYSIPAQTEKLKAYARLHDLHHSELFIDGGYSGSNLERPEIQRLITEAKEKALSHVIVYKLDRLSRSQKDTLYLIEDVFLPNAVDFVSINENIDTSSPYGRAMIGILSAFAQLERENIHMRTRMGMLERVKSGLWMGGGKIPYGYDYDRNLGILVPNEDAVKVQMMYEMYLHGDSPQTIAELFGLKYDRMVTQILSRRTNLGSIVYRGVEYEGQHAPIISKKIFEQTMEQMRLRGSGRKMTGEHLLSGLCVCGYCGSKMRYVRWGDKGYKLMCYSQDISKCLPMKLTPCANKKVWAQEIEDQVVSDLKHLSVQMNDEQKNEEEILAGGLKHQEKSLENKIKNLYHIYGENEDEYLLETIRECRDQLEKVKAQRKGLQEKEELSKKRKQMKESIIGLGQTWDTMSKKQQQEIVRTCVENIVIRGEESLRINYTI